MRISDWSSDVCSSDLGAWGFHPSPCPNAHSCPRPCRVPRPAFRQNRGRAGRPVAGSARAESRTPPRGHAEPATRSDEPTSELQSLMRISYDASGVNTQITYQTAEYEKKRDTKTNTKNTN